MLDKIIRMLNAGDPLELYIENEQGQVGSFSTTIEAVLAADKLLIQAPAGMVRPGQARNGQPIRMVIKKDSAGLLEMSGKMLQFSLLASGTSLIIELFPQVNQTQRRQYYRLPVVQDILLSAGAKTIYPAVAHDISAGGIRCVLPQDFQMGDTLRIELKLNEEDFYIKGRVLSCDPMSEHGQKAMLRIEFLDLTEIERRQILSFIFKEQSKRRKYMDQ